MLPSLVSQLVLVVAVELYQEVSWHYGSCVVLDGNPYIGQFRNDKVMHDGNSHCNMSIQR